MEFYDGARGHKRRGSHSVGYELPLDTIPLAIDAVEKRGHDLKKNATSIPRMDQTNKVS